MAATILLGIFALVGLVKNGKSRPRKTRELVRKCCEMGPLFPREAAL
jgi:hypothetical protein